MENWRIKHLVRISVQQMVMFFPTDDQSMSWLKHIETAKKITSKFPKIWLVLVNPVKQEQSNVHPQLMDKGMLHTTKIG